MTDAVLIFTFSPVQSFIAEARRAADLYVGSQILVRMAKAAAQAIGLSNLIYPAPQSGDLPDDVPNVLVARIPGNDAQTIADQAHQALLAEWRRLADTGRKELLNRSGSVPDATWDAIWTRQLQNLWQVFWAAAPIGAGGYSEAYQMARDALDAGKRSRIFPQAIEPGDKDSLSGTREALHRNGERAKEYWRQVARRATAAKLRPDGRERLDAVGSVKRFCELADKAIVSTSTIASADFREQAKSDRVRPKLEEHRRAVEGAIGSYLFAPRRLADHIWPYDGDLLFLDGLREERLKDSYHGVEHPDRLADAVRALQDVYKAADGRPSPYYAIIVLDGDSMGEHISRLLQKPDPEEAHRAFSRQLAGFAQQVPLVLGRVFKAGVGPQAAIADQSDADVGREFLVYNGGDDVLALAPLSLAVPMAQALAQEFAARVPGCHASAGIAVAHHLYPLDAALQAARAAEKIAKGVNGKAAVAVQVMKRSGETVTLRSKWDSLGGRFDVLVEHFREKRLSSRFAYDLSSRAHIVTALPSDARKATIKQLVERHKTNLLTNPDALVDDLAAWAQDLDSQTPPETVDGVSVSQGLAELARWIVFARFVAQGGSE